MRIVFVDTFYWVALANPRDDWHARVKDFSQSLEQTRFITTDEILVEFLALLRNLGPEMRRAAVRLARGVLQDPNTRVIPQTRTSFLSGLALYEARPDKEYSLTDCISMQTMREQGLTEVLTNDRHFNQEGFTLLPGSSEDQ